MEEKEAKLDEWDVLDFLQYPRNGIGTKKLFADTYKNCLRFVREVGMYFYFNGVVWEKDLCNIYAQRLATRFAQSVIETANKIQDDEVRNAVLKYYARYTEPAYREKLIRDAQSVYVIEYAEFDKHPELYNCKNGTFNLVTGELQPHRASDMLTQVSNVVYEKGKTCDRWEQFIDEVMEGDKASKKILQMISGYCLSGSTKLECFFMLYGPTTRNGKGTFNGTMFCMHGGYAKALQPEALSEKKFYSNSDAPNESIASLSGARYVSVSEPGEGLALDSSLIKILTGGDPITARFLHQHRFTYVPQFKIVINTNFLPTVTDETVFTSDRIILLNFTKHFNSEMRDPELKEKLTTEQSLSGIFNWCYDGYKMLMNEKGLQMPDKSKLLFKEYMVDSDIVQQFIDDCMKTCDGARTSFKKVYSGYISWCREYGYRPYRKKVFEKRLRDKKIIIENYGNRLTVFNWNFEF